VQYLEAFRSPVQESGGFNQKHAKYPRSQCDPN